MKRSLLVSAVLGGVGLAASSWMWDKMPAQMPIHWNISGQADGFMAKEYALFLFPGLVVLLPWLVVGLIKLDPRKANVDASAPALTWLLDGMSLFFLSMHLLVLHAAGQNSMDLDETWLFVLLGLLFVGIGALLPKVKSNWFVGIRTPWTLSSEGVWEKTHRLGAWCFIAAGLALIPSALWLPGSWKVAALVTLAMVAGLIPVVLSFVFYKREQAQQPRSG